MAAPKGVDPSMWAALLRWSLKQQDDGTEPSEFKQMTENDKEWLETVLKDGIVDYVERADEILKQYRELVESQAGGDGPQVDEAKLDEFLTITDELDDIVGQIDFAKSLVQIGGVQPLLDVAQCATLDAELRASVLGVIATVVQNNPFAQEAFRGANALEVFVALLGDPASPSVVRLKALSSTSCLIRGHAVLEQSFLAPPFDGGSILHACLGSGEPRLQRKATFLLNALITSDHLADTAQLVALLTTISPTLQQLLETSEDDIELTEHTLKLLSSFASRGLSEQVQSSFDSTLQEIKARALPISQDSSHEEKDNAAAKIQLIEAIQRAY